MGDNRLNEGKREVGEGERRGRKGREERGGKGRKIGEMA